MELSQIFVKSTFENQPEMNENDCKWEIITPFLANENMTCFINPIDHLKLQVFSIPFYWDDKFLERVNYSFVHNAELLVGSYGLMVARQIIT